MPAWGQLIGKTTENFFLLFLSAVTHEPGINKTPKRSTASQRSFFNTGYSPNSVPQRVTPATMRVDPCQGN